MDAETRGEEGGAAGATTASDDSRQMLLNAPIYNVRETHDSAPISAENAGGEQTLVVVSSPASALVRHTTGPLDQNPAAVYLVGLAAGSRRTMRASLNTIASLLTGGVVTDALALDWTQVRFQHTAAVRSRLAESYSPATANKMLAALRGTLKAAWRLGQIGAEAYQRACDVGTVGGETLPAGRAVASGELIGLMQACSRHDTIAGARDAAMLALLYGCGLRRAELVALDVNDYEARIEMGQGTLKVVGKRNKARSVPVVGDRKSVV